MKQAFTCLYTDNIVNSKVVEGCTLDAEMLGFFDHVGDL